MKALVTGGSGFIGSHLIDKLKMEGHEIFNYDIKKNLDIESLSKLKTSTRDFEPDVIYHLAGVLGTSELMQSVYLSERINVLGTINVLEICKELKIPLVFASKINPRDWVNPYTITKRACEEYCKMYSEQWNLKICVLKLLYVYGPRQKPKPVQKYVPTFITKALKNEDLPIWGTGEQYVDPVYVTDIAESFMKVTEVGCWGKTIEVGLGLPVKVSYVANKIIELLKSKSKLKYLPMRPGEPLQTKSRNLYADTRNMKKFLGIDPKNMVQLPEGLKKTISWWKEII